MTSNDILIAITKTPVRKINPVRKHDSETFYCWYNLATGTWVRSDNNRSEFWIARSIPHVKIELIRQTFVQPFNGAGDRYLVIHKIFGSYHSMYVRECLHAAKIVEQSDDSTKVHFTY